MTWKQWRERTLYLLMSAFLAWHTIAIVIAPASRSSVSSQTLRTAFQPYLTVLGLDNTWDFFAPSVGHVSMLRYVIENAAGERQTFDPTEELKWYLPSYFWFRTWYYAIIDDPERHVESAAALFCRKHASFRPVSITFVEHREGDFKPADQLAGKRPTDLEFVTVEFVKTVKCPDS